MRDPRERLRDILDAIAAIERYDRRDKATFGRDELFQVWFPRHLRIIGEAARALPEEVRALSSDIRWPSHAKPHPWHHRPRRGRSLCLPWHWATTGGASTNTLSATKDC